MLELNLPLSLTDKIEQQKFYYRAIEKLRLLHNEQKTDREREKCLSAQRKVFAKLNEIRDTVMPYDLESSEGIALDKFRSAIKTAGTADKTHDLAINEKELAGII